MQLARPVFGMNPRSFGRGPSRAAALAGKKNWGFAADVRLFAATFAAGFLFVSILIG